MRLNFSGLTQNALHLLDNFKGLPGSNVEHCRQIVAAIGDLLPEMQFARFFADVKMPKTLVHPRVRPSSPVINVTTNHAFGFLKIRHLTPSMDAQAIVRSVLDIDIDPRFCEAEFLTPGSSLAVTPERQFTPQKNIWYGKIEFGERADMDTYKDDIHIELEIKHPHRDGAPMVIQVHIVEKAFQGRGYRFAKKLAKSVPHIAIKYGSQNKKPGWRWCYAGWDWNKGYPVILKKPQIFIK